MSERGEIVGMAYWKSADAVESPELSRAIACGEVTEGGLAEAGYEVTGDFVATANVIKFQPKSDGGRRFHGVTNPAQKP